MLTIDGSAGEGGGQILRTALALSLVTGKAFRIERVRAGRKRPGLLHQHLAAVRAAAQIGQAQVEGAALGSGALTFAPGQVTPGNYHFAIGTAGSATLVLQTVLPALLTACGPSTLLLEGGTHNPAAPPFDFLQLAFLPLLNRMGAQVSAVLHRHGFFPAGGGKMEVSVQPAARLTRFELLERGPITHRRARVLLAGLPRHIAEREIAVLRRRLDWPEECCALELLDQRCGPGNAVIIELGSEQLTEVFTAFGERGVRAETVAETAAAQAARYLAAGVPVGEHLADQLLLPLALAGAGAFKTLPLSSHALTNIETLRSFLDIRISAESTAGDACIVRVGEGSH